jgi:integrase/recombinase XerD
MDWIRPVLPDLTDLKARASLKPRQHIYWRMLCFGRALGFHKRGHDRTFWVARAKKRCGGVVQHRFAKTDDSHPADGKEYLSHTQAVERAWEWFRTLDTSKVVDARPMGRATTMLYSPVGDVFTVGHALKDYMEWKQVSCTETTRRSMLSLINSHILPNVGTLALDDLTGAPLRKFIKDVMETPTRRSLRAAGERDRIEDMDDETLRKRKDRANTVTGYLRAAMVMAWENGKTDNERCWRSLRFLPNVSKPRLLHLTRAECKALIRQCPSDLAELVQGALYSGCRSTELLRMRVADVARDGYGVHVVPGKTFKPRFVFLPDEGMAFFLSLTRGKKPEDLLFVRSDGTAWGGRHRHILKRALRAAKLPLEFTFHGLRHTYASQLVQAGTPLIVISEQLGHTNIMSVSMVYGHLAPQIREAEVRQRFTSVNRKNHELAQTQKGKLGRLRNSVQTADWRGYARITDLASKGKTR